MSDKIKKAVIYIIFGVGAAGHLSGYLNEYMIKITPFVLIISGALVLLFSGAFNQRKFLIWFLISYLTAWFLEMLGVKTGLIFGEYIYGNTLGYAVAGVPLIIGFNWMFVILGGIGIGMKISGNKFIIAFSAGLAAVIFDLVLEPAAIELNYWHWLAGDIPFRNYLAWYIITFIFSLSYSLSNIKIRTDYFIHYFTAQFLFFLLLNLF